MAIIIVTPHYPPYPSSTANQISDLAHALSSKHNVIVISHAYSLFPLRTKNLSPNLSVISIGAFFTFSNIRFIRLLAELLQPYLDILLLFFFKTKLYSNKSQSVVLWSPPIFLSVFAWLLSRTSRSQLTLIHRDVFPRWALDVGIIKSKSSYKILSLFEWLQYLLSDIILTQSNSNNNHIRNQLFLSHKRIQCLPNWSSHQQPTPCQLPQSLEAIVKTGRKIILYAGSIGPAQDYQSLIDLSSKVPINGPFHLLFLGRGQYFNILTSHLQSNPNICVSIHEPIPNPQLLYLQTLCSYGLVSLNRHHTTTNIPGKYISYLRTGLPVLAFLNSSNPLLSEIPDFHLGLAYDSDSSIESDFFDCLESHHFNSRTIQDFFLTHYSVEATVKRLESIVL